MDISQISSLVAPEMAGLDKEMARILGSDHPFLQELSDRIMSAPGKRLRPKLLVMCGKMLAYEGDQAALYASVFELVHTATLIHDDIIDDAETRRGRHTLNHDLGKTITVLFGDLLYTKAYGAAVSAGRLNLLDLITWVSERMIEGELIQEKVNFDAFIDEETYYDILKRKTAFLFAGTTKAAGLIADRPERECQALFEYGFNFGVSFQLMDDYLNFTSTEAEMGKPVLSDLYDGKLTLPIIKLVAQHAEYRGLIQRIWDKDPQKDQLSQHLLAALGESSHLESTLTLAGEYAERAVNYLADFPDNEYSHILRALPFHLLQRRK